MFDSSKESYTRNKNGTMTDGNPARSLNKRERVNFHDVYL